MTYVCLECKKIFKKIPLFKKGECKGLQHYLVELKKVVR